MAVVYKMIHKYLGWNECMQFARQDFTCWTKTKNIILNVPGGE